MIRRQVKRSHILPHSLLIGMPLILILAILAVSSGASADSCVNVAGTWKVDSWVDATECGEGQYPDSITFTVTQEGCSIHVTSGSGTYYDGTVSGTGIHLVGWYEEDGGSTQETGDLTVDGNTISGMTNWTWYIPGFSCSGTTQIDATLENAPTPPEVADLHGTVKDATSGQPVYYALISLYPGGYQVSSGTDGSFSISELPPGTYTVQVSASGYLAKTFQDVELLSSLSNQLNVLLTPYLPQIISASASPLSVGNDGQGTTLLSVRVTHPLGLSSILSVFGDLSQIGGSTQQEFYDDGAHGDGSAGDGIYACQVTVAKGINARLYALNVTAFDKTEKEGFGSIVLNVTDKVSGSVGALQSASRIFENTVGGQDLNIHFAFLKMVFGSKAIKDECQVEVTVYDPNDVPYDTYYGTDDININIPDADPGEWSYEIHNPCPAALSYEVETSGAGTGMLVGRVVDGFSGAGVPGASIKCNTGGATMSLNQGYYSGVAVAGTGQVITNKAGYQTNIKDGVHVKAGTTTNLNIQIVPQDGSAEPPPSGQNFYQVLDPSEAPNPPTQPFAAKVSGSNLEFNVLFPRYQQAVDLYLGVTIAAPQNAGKLYLLNQNDDLVEYSGTLHAWRKGTTTSEGAQVLIPAESGSYPLGDYTLYALVTTDSATLANYDLSYFTTTLAQPPPEGQSVTYLSNPLDNPNPMTQPLAVKVAGGNLVLNAFFPLQAQPVTIFVAYSTPSGALYLFKEDGSPALFTGTLWPWRQNVRAEQAAQLLSIPSSQMIQGTHYLYSLVTTDPVSFSNYDLIYFALSIGK
jgi:hypothetical protein